MLDGVFTFLSDPGGAITQSATRSVVADSSLAFVINCTDCVGGGATASITNFQASAVPEPAMFALFGLGILAFVAERRRRRED